MPVFAHTGPSFVNISNWVRGRLCCSSPSHPKEGFASFYGPEAMGSLSIINIRPGRHLLLTCSLMASSVSHSHP